MRALFFGTPALAVPSLNALSEIAEVVHVFCQPDRPAGRGMKPKPPPVKARALELGLPVSQPTRLKPPSFAESLEAHGADVGLVVAYGRILPPAVLASCPRGFVNVHASLLPRWRGAGPIQWAIVHGDAESGVCLMQMEEGLDTGPVIACERTPIAEDETAGELGERLAHLGASLVRRRLGDWAEGRIEATPQPEVGVTYAPLIRKADGYLDWSERARALHDRARGLHPWPGATAELEGARWKLHRTRVVADEGERGVPGEVLAAGPDGLDIACGRGVLRLHEAQLEGRRRMAIGELLAGHPVAVGARFTTPSVEAES